MRAALIGLALTACTFEGASGIAVDGGRESDGMIIDAATSDGAEEPTFGAWETPMRLGFLEDVSGVFIGADDPVYIPTTQSIYWALSSNTGNPTEKIWQAKLVFNGLGNPTGIENPQEIFPSSQEGIVYVDDDELLMLLSRRGGANNRFDIYQSQRAAIVNGWDGPAPDLYANINSINEDNGAFFMSSDGLRVYVGAGLPEGDFDLAIAERATLNVPFEAPQPIALLSTPDVNELGGPLLFDETVMCMSRKEDNEDWDVYFARRGPSGDFEELEDVSELNSDSDDEDLFVTQDGTMAFFSSRRMDGSNHIYFSRRDQLEPPNRL